MKIIYKERSFKTQTITPKMALRLLSKPAPNRPLHSNQVKFLESEIRKGNFHPNGSPIIIDQYGRLMDGQHRCKAIANTGISVKSDFIYGQNYEETCHSLGKHQGRSNTDNSVMFHSELPHDAFSIAKAILSFETIGSFLKVNPLLNDGEVDDFINRNKDFFIYLKKHPNDMVGIVRCKEMLELLNSDYYFGLTFGHSEKVADQYVNNMIGILRYDP